MRLNEFVIVTAEAENDGTPTVVTGSIKVTEALTTFSTDAMVVGTLRDGKASESSDVSHGNYNVSLKAPPIVGSSLTFDGEVSAEPEPDNLGGESLVSADVLMFVNVK